MHTKVREYLPFVGIVTGTCLAAYLAGRTGPDGDRRRTARPERGRPGRTGPARRLARPGAARLVAPPRVARLGVRLGVARRAVRVLRHPG